MTYDTLHLLDTFSLILRLKKLEVCWEGWKMREKMTRFSTARGICTSVVWGFLFGWFIYTCFLTRETIQAKKYLILL